MIQRMIRAASLDSHLYEEVEHDKSAITQAMLIVVLVSIAKGIAALATTGTLIGIATGIIGGLVSWAIWAFVTYIVGSKLLKTPETHSSWGELARVTGFAQTPGLLLVFALLPFLGTYIIVIVGLWQVAAMVVGIRQALDYTSTIRAIVVVLIGFIISAALLLLLVGLAS